MIDDDDKNEQKPGRLIPFPNGERVSTDEIGTDFVVDVSGNIPTPEIIDTNALSKEFRERENYVNDQELYRAITKKIPVNEIVDVVLNEIAEEISHLKFERRKAAKDGKNTIVFTTSRIASLRQLADVLMKRMENARAEKLDLKSPRFKSVMRLWMEFLYESMQKCEISDEVIDLVFKQMEADMKDWELKLQDTV